MCPPHAWSSVDLQGFDGGFLLLLSASPRCPLAWPSGLAAGRCPVSLEPCWKAMAEGLLLAGTARRKSSQAAHPLPCRRAGIDSPDLCPSCSYSLLRGMRLVTTGIPQLCKYNQQLLGAHGRRLARHWYCEIVIYLWVSFYKQTQTNLKPDESSGIRIYRIFFFLASFRDCHGMRSSWFHFREKGKHFLWYCFSWEAAAVGKLNVAKILLVIHWTINASRFFPVLLSLQRGGFEIDFSLRQNDSYWALVNDLKLKCSLRWHVGLVWSAGKKGWVIPF